MRSYWLVKSEPDDFSLDDLERQGKEPWTGVRNYQARNFMRDGMKKGDLVLFYHSNITPPGVVGMAEVLSDPYADPTAFNPKSDYFDPKSNPENPTWILVDIGFREKFPRMVSLDEIRTHPVLSGMRVAQKGSRLSVQPVSTEHFETLVALAKA